MTKNGSLVLWMIVFMFGDGLKKIQIPAFITNETKLSKSNIEAMIHETNKILSQCRIEIEFKRKIEEKSDKNVGLEVIISDNFNIVEKENLLLEGRHVVIMEVAENNKYSGFYDEQQQRIILNKYLMRSSTLAHEVGHALGLGHDDFDSENVMHLYGNRRVGIELTKDQCGMVRRGNRLQ